MNVPVIVYLIVLSPLLAAVERQPTQAPLTTKWTKDVDPKNSLPKYSRPQRVREHRSNLNEAWVYAILPSDTAKPEKREGEESTPGGGVRAEWKSNDIWPRRAFDLKTAPTGEVGLLIQRDEETKVYVNGHVVKSVTGYSTDDGRLRLNAEAATHFKAGPNTLAVHCKQTGGGQDIEVGFVELSGAK